MGIPIEKFFRILVIGEQSGASRGSSRKSFTSDGCVCFIRSDRRGDPGGADIGAIVVSRSECGGDDQGAGRTGPAYADLHDHSARTRKRSPSRS